jgi:hypothetical protein
LAKVLHPQLAKKALFVLKFGKIWGYYDWVKFEKDLDMAVIIAEILYPGKKLVFLYDNSSVHRKRSDDALDEKKINVNPGGKQPICHDTILPNGQVSLSLSLSLPPL